MENDKPKFADVKNDLAFHKIFGNTKKTAALISFINAILRLPKDKKITFLEILNPYQVPNVQDAKSIIVDIKAKDKKGKEYIIEMQVADITSFDKRVLYYTSKNFADQIKRGDSYQKLNPIIFIGILNFTYTSSTKYLSKHQILDVETHESYLNAIEYYFVELPKFTKIKNELSDLVDEWLYFIKNAESFEKIPTDIKDEGLKNAYEDAAFFSWTKEELAAYDYMYMIQQDIRGREELALKRAKEEGKAEGMEKMAERTNEIIRNLIKAGLSNEIISKSTGLSIAEIEKMRNKI